MFNFYYRHGTDAVLSIHGCAAESLANGEHLTIREVRLFFPVVRAFIRDPLARCRSRYQFYLPRPGDPRHAPTWEMWVDRILDDAPSLRWQLREKQAGRLIGEPLFYIDDCLWLPQQTCLDEATVPVTNLHRFEDLNTVIPGLVTHYASTPATINAAYRIGELRTYYAADTALRASLP